MRIGFRERRRGILDRILIPKRAEIARMLAAPPFPPRPRSGGAVLERLRRPPNAPLRLIAEIKLRSPSAGDLSRVLSPERRALAYARAGASMISVLCDERFFGGSFAHLAAAREALDASFGDARPRLLAKEYILHRVQLDRAVDAGADSVLLIVRILTPDRLGALVREARGLGLEPLVEVATAGELALALAADARLIGVNARDLNTLRIDVERAAAVLAAIPGDVVAVHLSGLRAPSDVARVAGGPADAALIGEALMREDDPEPLLREMIAAGSAPDAGVSGGS